MSKINFAIPLNFRSDTVFSFCNGSQQGTVNNPLLVVFPKGIK